MESVNRILWVDDDVKRLELSVDIDEFTDRGFVITKAENPDEFNEIIAGRQDFQCIIVDISMPTGKHINFGEAKGGMRTGLIVLQQIVANEKLNDILKVAYTIVNDEEVISFCKKNGIYHLDKGKFLPDSFVDKIEQLLKSKENK